MPKPPKIGPPAACIATKNSSHCNIHYGNEGPKFQKKLYFLRNIEFQRADRPVAAQSVESKACTHIIIWIDDINDSISPGSPARSRAWLDRGMDLDDRSGHRRSRSYHHAGPVAANEWLVRFVLGFVGVPAHRVALEKTCWDQFPGLGSSCCCRSYYHGRTSNPEDRRPRHIPS